jgi:hypothetical protein
MAIVQDGWKVTEVADRLGVSRQSVHKWIARYDAGGLPASPTAPIDRRAVPRSPRSSRRRSVSCVARPRVGTAPDPAPARQAGRRSVAWAFEHPSLPQAPQPHRATPSQETTRRVPSLANGSVPNGALVLANVAAETGDPLYVIRRAFPIRGPGDGVEGLILDVDIPGGGEPFEFRDPDALDRLAAIISFQNP